VLKSTLALLVLVLLGLQYKAWFGEVGYFANRDMREKVEEQHRRADVLRQRNRILTAEVLALREGHDAVEARARNNLGMVKEGETFYLVGSDGH